MYVQFLSKFNPKELAKCFGFRIPRPCSHLLQIFKFMQPPTGLVATTHTPLFCVITAPLIQVTEITILAAGFFIGFVDPLIHEFCLLAVMGLLSDYFLQTFFFPTVLSMDMRQLEMSDHRQWSRSTFRRKELFHQVMKKGRFNKVQMW